MKKWIKGSISLALVAIMVLAMAGCGGKRETDPALIAAAKENVYKYTDIDIFERSEEEENYIDYNISGMSYSDGKLAILARVYSWASDDWFNETQLVTVNADGTGKQVAVLTRQDSSTESSNTYMSNLTLVDNCVYAVEQSTNYEVVDEFGIPEMTVELICYSFAGEEQWRKSVMPENMPDGEYFYVDRLVALADGQVMVYAMQEMVVYDSTGEQIGRVKPDLENGVNNIFADRNGNLLVSFWDAEWTNLNFAYLDMQTGQMGEPFEFPFNMNNYNIRPSEYHDMLLTNSVGVFAYNIGDEEVTPLMNYVNSDLATSNVYQICEISETEFMGCYYNSEYMPQLAKFTYVDPGTIADKAVLKLATFYIPYDVRDRVVEYNKTNEQYRIIITDYSQYSTSDDYLAGYTKFNNDILAGNVPDIIILDDELPVDSYIQKGFLADIYEFIDKDEELSRDKFFQNVLDAYTVNGQLYCITPGFNIRTVLAKASNVGTEPGWTIKEMQQILDSKSEETSLFGADYTRDSLMYEVTRLALPEFIDKETGTCNFDSQGFKDLLEFLKTLPTENSVNYEDPDFWTNYELQYMNDKTLAMTYTLSDVQSLIYTCGQFGTTDVTFIGFPSESGIGATINTYNRYAISAQSPNQEGAWEFLRYYYTDEYQREQYYFPINKDIWWEKAQTAMERPHWEDENGEIHYEDYTYWFGNEEVKLEPFTQEQVQEVYDYVCSVTRTSGYDEELVNIINEEAAPFFEGQKNIDDVVKIIQGRIQVYVDENR